MYGNYYTINLEYKNDISKEFRSDMERLVSTANMNNIKCVFKIEDGMFSLEYAKEEPLNFECNNHATLGIPSRAGLRTHPSENSFDSVVKVALMICQKHNLIYNWITDGSESSAEWLLAIQLANLINLDYTKYKPKDEFNRNGFIGDLI